MQQELSQKTVDELYPYIQAFKGNVYPSNVDIDHGRTKSITDIYEMCVSVFRAIEVVTHNRKGYNILAAMTDPDMKAIYKNVADLVVVLGLLEEKIYNRSEHLESDSWHIREIFIDDYHRLLESRKNYGDSWCKRGGVGAFMMLARKYDRLTNFVDSRPAGMSISETLTSDSRKEGVLDDIGDLRRYLLLCFGLASAILGQKVT